VVTAATTSLAAVIGEFPRGSTTEAVLVSSWPQFESAYGELTAESSLAAYAVWQFFQNGGIGAWIVRITRANATPASAIITPLAGASSVKISANSPGLWGRTLEVATSPSGPAAAPSDTHVDFVVSKVGAEPTDRPLEMFSDIAILESDGETAVPASHVAKAIAERSNYIVAGPTDNGDDTNSVAPAKGAGVAATPLAGGSDGDEWAAPTRADTAAANTLLNAIKAELQPDARLDHIAPAVFNLMCIPDLATQDIKTQGTVFAAAHGFCEARQAFLLVDPPPPSTAGIEATLTVDQVGASAAGLSNLVTAWAHNGGILSPDNIAAATYYPWVQINDPLTGLARYVPPSGTIAGVYASTDASRGVWKAPAGAEALLAGVTALADTTISDTVNGELNFIGINCLRTLPVFGHVVWGSRTLAGSDLAGSAYKYVPVRRLTNFIEQSLTQSLRWTVYEPNGPALWSSISIEVTRFMASLFAQGAFGGTRAATAYTIACDASTTSPADILAGIVNVSVGFLPVDPAEFIMLNIQLDAASAAS
jgi:hypothetical protein